MRCQETEGVRKALFTYRPRSGTSTTYPLYAAAYSGGTSQRTVRHRRHQTPPARPLTSTAQRRTPSMPPSAGWAPAPAGVATPTDPGKPGSAAHPAAGQDASSPGSTAPGLVLYAYAQIGIRLPHLAHDITYNSGGQVIRGTWPDEAGRRDRLLLHTRGPRVSTPASTWATAAW